MKTSESINELAKALASFQADVKQPDKDKVNPHFRNKYTSLDAIVKAIQAAAPKHGLSFTQIPTVDERGVSVTTVIMHSSGQFIEFPPITLPMDKRNAQGAGSSISYGRRYSLAAAFGLASDEDDDGNAAAGVGQQQRPPQQRPPFNQQQQQRPPQQQQRQQQPPKQQQRPPAAPQTPPKQEGGGITAEQTKALKEAVDKAALASGLDIAKVYESAAQTAGVPGKASKQLTKEEADKVLQFLGEFGGMEESK